MMKPGQKMPMPMKKAGMPMKDEPEMPGERRMETPAMEKREPAARYARSARKSRPTVI